MTMKDKENQKLVQRRPTQQRAQHKVELILEAAMRLLDKGGFPALTTNAVAETAGVSIGTLYQYFANKEAILGALADREMAGLSQGVLVALDDAVEASPRDRIARIIGAVVSAFGGRPRVHRLVMQHSLEQGGQRLAPLIEQLVASLTEKGRVDGSGRSVPLGHADAFVLTHAFAGVMRAMILWPETAPAQHVVEDALSRMVLNFAGGEAP